MVVCDQGFNGYREVILPMAYQDDVIQRTVSVVAALHLSRQRPDLLPCAESGRAAIIQRLRTDALGGRSDKVFNLSTWATIVLLLVGETVTGSSEFVHLYAMLTSFLNQTKPLRQLQSTEARFILQQSRLYVLGNLIPPP